MTVTTTASTPAGTYPITITATSGTLQHTAQVSLVVSGTADFNITATPASQTVTQGGNATYSARISAVNGFTGAVTFAASGLPTGATASFSPTSVSGGSSSAMTVTTTASTLTQGEKREIARLFATEQTRKLISLFDRRLQRYGAHLLALADQIYQGPAAVEGATLRLHNSARRSPQANSIPRMA